MTPLEKLERLRAAYEANDTAGDKVIDAFYRCITIAQERRFPKLPHFRQRSRLKDVLRTNQPSL